MRNRRIITIDIETLPADETVDCFLKESERADVDKENLARLKTALNGDFGRVLCIGFSDERADGTRKMGFIGWDNERSCLHCDERRILEEFWRMIGDFDPKFDRIVGHNIFDFDLLFIIKRSIINRVRPSVEFNFAKYRSVPIFDTMCEWECWKYGNKTSLDNLAVALSLTSSKTDDVNGSRVSELYEAGRHQEIKDYCLDDVRLTRQIYKRMTFTTDEDLGISPRGGRVEMSLKA